MTRFRKLSTGVDASADADVKALMEDIDASLVDFEKRLEAEHAALNNKSATSIVHRAQPLPGKSELPEVGTDSSEPISPGEASGFLAELEHEAAALSGSGEGEARQREIRERRVHDTLGRVFNFLNAFCRHANALAPAITRPYRLDARIIYSDLKWQEASVRYRLQNLREKALMDYVTLNIQLAAPAPVEVVRRWDQIEQLKKEMHILDLKPAEGLDIDEKPQQENVKILLAPDFPVQLTFRANYKKDRIDLLSRNLDGFGIAAFVSNASEVTQQLLDDLGRFLINRTDKLPAGLQPVHLRSQL
jgi:hypothetical protein